MARWKLTEKHYLKVPGTRWEFQTVDRNTGRPMRKTFEVPLYLDPEDKDCWNNRGVGMYEDGFITVAHAGKGEAHDIIFVGNPTPGMLPIDDEAVAISAKFNWTPTQGLDQESQENSHQNRLLLGLIDQMAEAQTKAMQPKMPAGMEQLITVLTQMMSQQGQLIAALAAGRAPAPEIDTQGEEQVIDDLEPLPEAEEPTPEEIAASQRAFEAGQKKAEADAVDALARRTRRV